MLRVGRGTATPLLSMTAPFLSPARGGIGRGAAGVAGTLPHPVLVAVLLVFVGGQDHRLGLGAVALRQDAMNEQDG